MVKMIWRDRLGGFGLESLKSAVSEPPPTLNVSVLRVLCAFLCTIRNVDV